MKALNLALSLAILLSSFSSHASALMSAIEDGSLSRVKAQVSKASVNLADAEGITPLELAVSTGASKEIVATLLEAGARTDLRTGEKKQSVLFEAVRLGHSEIIELLIKKDSALIDAKDSEGETALFEAVRSAQSTAVRTLLAAGADAQIKNKKNQRAVDLANPKTDQKMIEAFKKTKSPRKGS